MSGTLYTCGQLYLRRAFLKNRVEPLKSAPPINMKVNEMNQQKEKTTKKYRLDIIVISAVLIFSLFLVLGVFLTREEGSIAVVEVDGEVFGKYPLTSDGVFSLNGGTNILVIENGAAYLNYSDCPDHVCERTGKIRHVGESIICLPNRLSVTVKGDANGGVDFVS